MTRDYHKICIHVWHLFSFCLKDACFVNTNS